MEPEAVEQIQVKAREKEKTKVCQNIHVGMAKENPAQISTAQVIPPCHDPTQIAQVQGHTGPVVPVTSSRILATIIEHSHTGLSPR